VQQALDAPNMPRRWLRPIYLMLGIAALAVGAVGLFLPLIPTTGPILLAAFFFARSSERLHRWLVGHPRFGRLIADFQAGRGIPWKAKVTALIAMTAAFAYSIGWVLDHPAGRVAVGLVAVGALGYVLRLPLSDRPATEGD
jgi:uncharacterized membrane protein YbaN (DUF454 family)